MPIKHIISMFEQKIAKIFEKMVLLKGNLPLFAPLNFYIRHLYLFEDMIV